APGHGQCRAGGNALPLRLRRHQGSVGLMMSLVRRLAAAAMPRRSPLAFRIATKIINLYNNDNDFDMRSNGELRLARRLLPHATIAFDVGANRGEWSAAALSINPRAEIHAFEPSPATYALLVEHLGGRVVANNT